jgi:hypothetical protein
VATQAIDAPGTQADFEELPPQAERTTASVPIPIPTPSTDEMRMRECYVRGPTKGK